MKRKYLTALAISISLTALTACGQQTEPVSNMTETSIETTSEPVETATEQETETEQETTEPVETAEPTETVETETVTEITEITEITETEETADSDGFIVTPISQTLYASCTMNGRKGPSTEFDVVEVYEIGSEIEVDGYYEGADGIRWYHTSTPVSCYLHGNLLLETAPTPTTGTPDPSTHTYNPSGIPITDDAGNVIGYDNSPAATGDTIINPETGRPAQPGDTWKTGIHDEDGNPITGTYAGDDSEDPFQTTKWWE